MSLWDQLITLAASGEGRLWGWTGSDYAESSWREVTAQAADMGVALRRAGVRPGSTVVSILVNTPLTVRGILGTWMAGGALASLPAMARGMTVEAYLLQLEAMCERIDPVAFVVDEQVLALLPQEFRRRVRARSWETFAGSGRVEPTPPAEDALAFIQFSSGSTSEPKGCMLTTRAIESQIAIIAEMLGLDRHAACDVTWLPLSHDMGLIGNLLTPWAWDLDLVLSTPERFMMRPRSWFEDIARFEATLTCSTNTALGLAARRQGSHRLPGPVRLRTMILGAERNECRTLDHALEVFAPYGLRREAFMPAYGLAEATLAVTATPNEEQPRWLVVDGARLADGRIDEVALDAPGATAIVGAGRPCQGVELPGLSEERLEEVIVRSPSLASGYAGDPATTAERFVDGAFRTGDLGFMRDGCLYPVGRSDDVIQVDGRNVYAREIEAAIDDIDGLRPGCSTLVDLAAARRELVLLVELADAAGDPAHLAERAAAAAMDQAAVALDRCLFLRRGTLPKTPSGKVQRYRCRQLVLDGELAPAADVALGPLASGAT